MWYIQMKYDQMEALKLRILSTPDSFLNNQLILKSESLVDLQMNKDFGVIPH